MYDRAANLPETPWNKKYYTDEERKAAKVRKDAKYYQEHKTQYNEKMNAAYHKQGWGYYIQKRYNLSESGYNNLLVKQNNSCAICGCTEDATGRRFAVDHDHKCCAGAKSCGKCIRGLLCGACNTALGKMKDDPTQLVRAATYIILGNKEHV